MVLRQSDNVDEFALEFAMLQDRKSRAHRAAERTGRFGFVQPRPQPDVCGGISH